MSALRIIREADQQAGAGKYLDAWEALETLPPRCRLLPAALRVRLLICTGLGRWRVGESVAQTISHNEALTVREAAGRFYLARAQAMMNEHLGMEAADAIRRCREIWPEGLPVLQESGLVPAKL